MDLTNYSVKEGNRKPLEVAREYTGRGWYVVPIPAGTKYPRLDGWQTLRLDEETLPSHFNGQAQNIGVLLGASGLVDIDLDSPEAIRLAEAFLPSTGAIFGRPGAPGSHRLYRVTGGEPKTMGWDDPRITDKQDARSKLVELRAGNHQTVLPPSVHPTGELIEWAEAGEPAEVTREELETAVSKLAAAALLARYWPDKGSRNEVSLALAGGLIRGSWSHENARAFILAVAQAADDDEATERARAVDSTVTRLASDEAATGWPKLSEVLGNDVTLVVKRWLGITGGGHTLDEFGNLDRLVDLHGEHIRWVEGLGWLAWSPDEGRWVTSEAQVTEFAKEAVSSIFKEAEAVGRNSRRGQALMAWANRSRSAKAMQALLWLAERDPKLQMSHEELDKDAYLLNCLNGTVDLRTGELRPHESRDYITKQTHVAYDPAAECPKYEKTVREIFGGDEAMVSYWDRVCGYCATSAVNQQEWYLLYGTGSNGKSLLMGALKSALGDYQQAAPASLMIQEKSGSATNDQVRLRGARLTVAVETGDGKRLNEAKVKALTGGDIIVARYLRQEFIEFKPTHKIMLLTNHKPQVPESSEGTWRRIRLIPFTRTWYKPEDGRQPVMDRTLEATLPLEGAGILARIVRGAVEMLTAGMQPPASVLAATDEYRSEQDMLGQFIADRTEVMPKSKISAQQLYGQYALWTEVSGGRPKTMNGFTQAMIEAGYPHNNLRGAQRKWLDLKLRPENPYDDPTIEILRDATTADMVRTPQGARIMRGA